MYMVSVTIEKKNASTKEGKCFYNTKAAKGKLGVPGTSHTFWMTFFVK
jgi:hypothetical protein